jgi:hypothetical protein
MFGALWHWQPCIFSASSFANGYFQAYRPQPAAPEGRFAGKPAARP